MTHVRVMPPPYFTGTNELPLMLAEILEQKKGKNEEIMTVRRAPAAARAVLLRDALTSRREW
jgi:hypothetical protein